MQTSNQIQQVNQSSLTRFTPQLTKLLEVVTEPTAEIIKARHEGVMFYEMGERNSETAATLIVSDLSLLTGLKIPTGNAFDRLIQLVAESLRKDYRFYTTKLMLLGLKKHAHVLKVGKEKSYTGVISLEDINQIMNEYSLDVFHANKEVDDITTKQADEKKIAEEDKQNIMRGVIEEKYKGGDFDCTYADFNQLLRDGIINESSLKKVAWKAISTLKEKYINISARIATGNDEDPESIAGVIEKRNYQEKIKLLSILEDEIKAQTATLFLKWAKENGRENIYVKETCG